LKTIIYSPYEFLRKDAKCLNRIKEKGTCQFEAVNVPITAGLDSSKPLWQMSSIRKMKEICPFIRRTQARPAIHIGYYTHDKEALCQQEVQQAL
jgi:hypothetical protein